MNKLDQIKIAKAKEENFENVISVLVNFKLPSDGISDHFSNFFIVSHENTKHFTYFRVKHSEIPEIVFRIKLIKSIRIKSHPKKT